MIADRLRMVERELAARAESLRTRRFPMVVDSKGRLIVEENRREEIADELEVRLENLEDELEDRLKALEDQLEDRWERMEDVLDRMFDRFEQMLDESRKDRE
mgnify:CR=1 FL=1